jgi:Flp pilus assembly protein CpaB
MSNSRLLLIGACVAVVAAVLAAGVQRLLGPGSPEGSAVTSVMAVTSDLPPGHRLTQDDLETVQGMIGSGAKVASTDAKPLIGRALAVPLRKGQIVRQEHLAARGSGADIAAQLPAGHRALTVMLRDPIAASSLFPGAMVDVLATVDKSGPGNVKESVTRTVIERAKVLALADDAATRSPGQSDSVMASDRRPAQPKKVAVTLGVTAEQAAELELAASRGTIGLALRAASDTGSGASQARNQNIAGNAAASSEGVRAPAPTPASASVPTATTSARQGPAQTTMWGVTVIRGDSTVKHEFPDRGAAKTP